MRSVTPPSSPFAPDCRHFLGDRPCIHNRLCSGCEHYAPYEARILIVKLGALGDVIRTLCILPRLRRDYPDAHITWVTKPGAKRMIETHPQIDRVVEFDPIAAMTLSQQRYDLMICLDKEAEPCALANSVDAEVKLGVGLSPYGTPMPLNPQGIDYFSLGLSDELKFKRNTKSYPQLVYEALGWDYQSERYELPLIDAANRAILAHLRSQGWDPARPTIGINVGAGAVFANKMWPAARQIELINLIHRRHPQAQIVLMGGPDERKIVTRILHAAARSAARGSVIDGGCEHHETHFVALVDKCDVLFTGDTMAMHVAVARQVNVVAFFGPTCEQEISLFGRGEKLVATSPCAPCYKRKCDQHDICLDDVPLDAAADAIGRWLSRSAPRKVALPVVN